MGQPGAEALALLGGLRRQLRDIKGITEARPGVFVLGGRPFVDLLEGDGSVHAEMRAGDGLPAQRFVLAEPVAMRKLVEEAKRRAARHDDS